MIPRYMGTAASIEALTELKPVPDDREEELMALTASSEPLESPSEASEADRYFWKFEIFPAWFNFWNFILDPYVIPLPILCLILNLINHLWKGIKYLISVVNLDL